MNTDENIPVESKLLVAMCETIIPIQEKISLVAKQASTHVVGSIGLLDTGKAYEFAISAYVGTWGSGASKLSTGYGDVILDRLARLGDFVNDIKMQIVFLEEDKKVLDEALKTLDSVLGSRSEFSGSLARSTIIKGFVEQNRESLSNQIRLIANYLNAIRHLLEKAIKFEAIYKSQSPIEIAINSIAVADMVRKEVDSESESPVASDNSDLRLAVKAMQAKFKEGRK